MAGTIRVEMQVNGEDMRLGEGRLLRFLVNQSTVGSDSFTMQVEATAWHYWDSLYDPEAEVRLRWGYIPQKGSPVWSEWHKFLVHDLRTQYRRGYVLATVSGMDLCYKVNTLCSKKVFKKRKISDIVSELASDAGVSAEVESTKDEWNLTQGTLTNGQFIRYVCLPRAYSGSRYDYLLYSKNGDTLVFKPPNLGDSLGEITFGREDGFVGAMGPMTLHYRPLMLVSNLSYATEFRTMDWLKKKDEFFFANEGTVSYQKLSSKGPPTAEDPVHIVPVCPENFKDRSKATYSGALRELWALEFDSGFAPQVQVGRTVVLNAADGKGATHGMSGKYIVGGVVHFVGNPTNEAWSHVFLQRRTSRIS